MVFDCHRHCTFWQIPKNLGWNALLCLCVEIYVAAQNYNLTFAFPYDDVFRKILSGITRYFVISERSILLLVFLTNHNKLVALSALTGVEDSFRHCIEPYVQCYSISRKDVEK